MFKLVLLLRENCVSVMCLLLGSFVRNYKRKLFLSATKIGEITTKILNCYFLKYIYTLRHQANYLHIKNKFTSHKQYSIGLIFSGNLKKVI